MERQQQLVALIDMDGTIADFDIVMNRELERLASPGERPFIGPDGLAASAAYIRARRRLIRSMPGFWRSLPRYEPGFEILAVLQDMGFRCCVLTKGPSSMPTAWAEKVEWCRIHLGDMPILMTEDKSLVYGRVLVDDWPAYFIPWLDHRPRGLVIVPAHPWNAGCCGHPQLVRYDGSNMSEIRERLKLVAVSENDR